jgi:hypothetical protein
LEPIPGACLTPVPDSSTAGQRRCQWNRQIINHFTNWPIGLMVFVGNAPLFLLGWRFLGGARFAMRTAFAIAVFSILTDVLVLFIPQRA